MHVSDPNHYTWPGCNFWYINFDTMKVSGPTVEFDITSQGNIEVGMVLCALQPSVNMGGVLANEENAGLIGEQRLASCTMVRLC